MRAMIVFNPIAGLANPLARDLDAAAQVLSDHGWQIELCPTAGPGDGTLLARSAAEQRYDVVVAAGGDGTINEVVNGLAGSATALATLPLGTMNVWARELGLPLQPRAAAETLLDWQVRPIDLGRAGDRYFLLMAGIGLDAAITAGVQAADKRRLGMLAYVLRGLAVALHIRGTRVRMLIDDRRVKGRVLLVVVGNSQLYGGLVKITHRASIDDGLLDVCVIKGNGFASALFHSIAIISRRYSNDPEIEYYRARSVKVFARSALPVQVDGDTIGSTPMTFEVAQGALLALMPAQLPDDLVQYRPQEMPRAARSLQRLAAWLTRRARSAPGQSGADR